MPRGGKMDDVRIRARGHDWRIARVSRRRIDRGRSLVARRRVIVGRIDRRPAAIGRRAVGRVVAVSANVVIINPAAAVIAAPVTAAAAKAPTPIAAEIGGSPPVAMGDASAVNPTSPTGGVRGR